MSLFARIYRRLRRMISRVPERLRDHRQGTFLPQSARPRLHACLHWPVHACGMGENEPFIVAIQGFLSHRFDLLGSGWCHVFYGMEAQGLEGICYPPTPAVLTDPQGEWLVGRINSSNLAESQRIWRLVSTHYQPIDWHIDFRSGYRWTQDRWSNAIALLGVPGADIKMPWELARMQHLPQLALMFSAMVVKGGKRLEPDAVTVEFRNQVLDFIASNPPRFGVNWICTMDVAIRVCNLLIAWNLFSAAGAKFDDDFVAVFSRSVQEHALHIAHNLEWDETVRGNHYLADIIGLLFVSASLERTPEIDSWLAVAVQELIGESQRQFLEDGANFEASTSYHRLSLQLLVYGFAIVIGLSEVRREALKEYSETIWNGKPPLHPAPIVFFNSRYQDRHSPIPEDVFKRLVRSAEFILQLTKPNGLMPQIGDNDSGFLFRLHPDYRFVSASAAANRFADWIPTRDGEPSVHVPDEEQRDHRHVVAAVSALLCATDLLPAIGGNGGIEAAIIQALAGCKNKVTRHVLPAVSSGRHLVGADADWEHVAGMAGEQGWQSHKRDFMLPAGTGATEPIYFAFKAFGVYLLRSETFYVAIRCGQVGQEGIGGHAHNDQLAVEISIDGADVITDPGTYVYTSLPNERNRYRSVKAHFAPRLMGEEPAGLNAGLFRLYRPVAGVCKYFGPRGFAGMHLGFSQPVYRTVAILADRLRIIDCSPSAALCPLDYAPPPLSPRYGVKLRKEVGQP